MVVDDGSTVGLLSGFLVLAVLLYYFFAGRSFGLGTLAYYLDRTSTLDDAAIE